MHGHRTRRSIVAFAALGALLAGVGAAQASSGGLNASGGAGGTPTGGSGQTTPVTPGCPNKQLGRRTLKIGDCGGDVATLNWILRAKDYGNPELVDQFESPTEAAVVAFQRDADLTTDGIVDSETSAALVNAMPPQIATWYGPGFFGNQTACGVTLTRQTMGVAHKTLPCGSKVVLHYNGRFVRTTVIDRGPFANDAKWDLTQATAEKLRFEYTDEIRVAKIAAPASE
ncbi:MAG: rare lipoprotein [Solirubrobacterales bacterium]|jgi:peptidoglycan hydrolase-like protein with peptidoglycan-binding domain|nr:rare lipoprotein [Solirubrobacterales bacterium]